MPEEQSRTNPQNTLTVLRALTHPERMKMVSLLTQHEPLRTSDVAKRLGIAPNSASFHLRQLEKAGVIAKAPTPAAGDGRETWWKTVDLQDVDTDPTQWRPEKREAGFASMQASLASMSATINDCVLTAARAAADGREERDLMASYQMVRLTAEQARRLRDKFLELLEDATGHDAEPSEGAHLYYIQTTIAPELRFDADGAGPIRR